MSLYSHRSDAGLLVESLVFITSSSELFRFLQTIGIARAHEPSQIKLKFVIYFFFTKTKSHLANVRSSSPIFSLSFAICRRRASNLNTHLTSTSNYFFTLYKIESHILLNVLQQNHYQNKLNYYYYYYLLLLRALFRMMN